MTTIQEQIDARKRRLEQLKRLTNVDKEPPNNANIKSSVETVDSAPAQIEPSQAVSNTDHGNKNSQDSQQSQESQDYSPHDGTEIMRNALREPLDELDRRTDKAIQRLVRQRLISDAMNRE
ncbi:hypothetical protein ZYGR_0C00180 [Zygosaccharomyces rouxii]|uniref:ZYRO0A13266p n=2 Tax=Zygosaccharomyces rouxii TaxID=4956 RepID=C5DP11_ZYGRC|nr:uncharacterized protein ZYRO0A13266g [Zygosaccharomyces rouxii]KAH9198476.1 hypothetical protein LQ764DRAFT_221387 [Zygosaccharomyces rouxii]GAV46976.1 hypothetical protein ZYGR_0C00180 [Zygosaccharomyces rouxii]CAR26002.1 ZYRO0A13266p [Zygosaccharomyces rouxii]